MVRPKAIPIICGPTASGKTGVAMALAGKYPIEVISADSRQIVRHLDIGTAKPTADERSRVRFHLVDIIEPGERYTAFRFIDDAKAAIDEINGRRRLPLIVGGTGFYLRALTEGVVETESDDLSVRERLQEEMELLGPEQMHERLRRVDPQEAAKLHPNNRVRVIRALEIFHMTGKCKSELVVTGVYRKSEINFDYYCLLPERQPLYDVIGDRVDEMMARGLLGELRRLVDQGLRETVREARVIGYSELLEYLDGSVSLEEAVGLIKQNTRRYAKRQSTWFRRQVDCRFYSDGPSLNRELEEVLGGES